MINNRYNVICNVKRTAANLMVEDIFSLADDITILTINTPWIEQKQRLDTEVCFETLEGNILIGTILYKIMKVFNYS